MWQKARAWQVWKPARITILVIVFIVAGLLLLAWQFGSRPGGLSPAETSALSGSHLQALAKNPFFAPWHLLQDLFIKIGGHSTWLGRLPSVLLGLGFLAVFYYLISTWFGKLIAVFSTIFLGATPFYILLARSGTPRVMYFMPILLIGGWVWLARSRGSLLAWCALAVAVVISLYVPGLIWLVLAGAVSRLRPLLASWRSLKARPKAILSLAMLILVAPLVIILARHPALIKPYFLIPAHPSGFLDILSGWGWMILAFVFKSQTHQTLQLGQTAILDGAQIGLALLGGYIMWSRLRTSFYWLIGVILFVCLVAGANNNFYLLAMALPAVIIMLGLGLRYLFVEWIHVFPRNPLPRYFAGVLMSALVIIHVLYGVRYGLLAWPHSLAVQHLYVLK